MNGPLRRSPHNIFEIALSFTIFFLVLFGIAPLLINFFESREGAVLKDPILGLFLPMDLSCLSFLLIYGAILIGFVTLSKVPTNLCLALQAYSLMLLFRMLTMFLLPIDPPPLMITLRDPFVEILARTNGKSPTRDLFFSGHVSTMFLLYLTAPKVWLKKVYLTGCALVGLFLILQHVHYVIDIIAAPFFAFGAFYLVKKLQKNKGIS